MSKHFCLLACVLGAIAVICAPSNAATPSYRGYTGLIIIPNADALGKGEWDAGFFFEDVASGTVNDVVANYGFAEGFEFGIDRFKLNDNSDNHTLLNAKYRFMPETSSRPAIAAGIIDVTDEIDTTVYVVGSKVIGCMPRVWEGETLSPRVHLGFGGGRLSGLFAGATFYLGNRFEVLAEWDSVTVNVGLRFRVTPGFTIHAGGLNLQDKHNESFTSNNASFGVGASYSVAY